MLNFLTHLRAKADNGWIGRVYVRHGNVVVYREGLIEGKYPVDELIISHPCTRPRRDMKRVHAGIQANVVELSYGSLALTPRPDPHLRSPSERAEESRGVRGFWLSVRQQQDALRAKRLRGEL